MKPANVDREIRRPLRDAQRPYTVVIVAGAKRGTWGRFANLEAAASVASKLRRHGMAAVVEDDGEVAA